MQGQRVRTSTPTFDVAVEVRGVGRFVVHERVTEAIDEILFGNNPRGLRVGKWPNLRPI